MPKDLNPRQAKFVKAYVKSGNATEAAAEAGYTGERTVLASTGSMLLRNPNVRAELDKALERYSAAKVVEKLGEQSEADIADFIDIVDPQTGAFQFNVAKAIAAGKSHLIKKLKHDPETGAPIIDLHDSQAALKELARIHGLAREPEEKKDEAVRPIRVQILQILSSDPEARRMVDALAVKALPEPER